MFISEKCSLKEGRKQSGCGVGMHSLAFMHNRGEPEHKINSNEHLLEEAAPISLVTVECDWFSRTWGK